MQNIFSRMKNRPHQLKHSWRISTLASNVPAEHEIDMQPKGLIIAYAKAQENLYSFLKRGSEVPLLQHKIWYLCFQGLFLHLSFFQSQFQSVTYCPIVAISLLNYHLIYFSLKDINLCRNSRKVCTYKI